MTQSKVTEFVRFLTEHNKLDRFTIELRAQTGGTRTIMEFLKGKSPVEYLKSHVDMFQGEWVRLDHDWCNKLTEEL